MKKLYTIYFNRKGLTMDDCRFFDRRVKSGLIEWTGIDDLITYHSIRGEDLSLAIRSIEIRFPELRSASLVTENAKTGDEIEMDVIALNQKEA